VYNISIFCQLFITWNITLSHKESFNVWSAFNRINTEGKSWIMTSSPIVVLVGNKVVVKICI